MNFIKSGLLDELYVIIIILIDKIHRIVNYMMIITLKISETK